MTSVESPVQLRPKIIASLEQYARKRHVLSLLRAVGLAIVAAILWLIIWGAIDRFVITIPSSGRLFLLFVLILLEAGIVRRSLSGFLRQDVNWFAIASEIEALDPRFGEALMTVVSESLLSAQHRASVEMVDQLADRVESEMNGASPPASPSPAAARLAAGIAGIGLALFISLFFWPRLGMRELVARQLLPMANLAPVKTTQLSVQPGSRDYPQGQPFTITATVEQLQGSTVMLRTTTDNRNWSAVGMTPSGNGQFTHMLPPITRDFTYRVVAGDAVSEPAHVRVLRPPLVKEFRIRLAYPKYVARAPLILTNTDGVILAPTGTEATIVVTASDPLNSATFIVDGKRIEGRPLADRRSWQAQFTILRDSHWQLEMTSDRGFPGAGPGEMPIRAIPDHAPIARLAMPEGALFLRPRDTVQIPYQAADDYALDKLEARISINNALAATHSLPIGSDPQHVENFLLLDLSDYKVLMGDLVTVTIAATDRASPNQTTQTTPPCRILIASQPVTLEQRRCIAALQQSARLANSIITDLDAAQAIADGSSQINSRVFAASESASLLVQSLLHSDSIAQDDQLAKTLAALADAATVQSARLEMLGARLGATDSPAGWLARERDDARKLQFSVSALWQGLSSEVIVAEQAGLDAARAQANSRLEDLREDVGAELHGLGIDAQGAAISADLQSRIAAARQLTAAAEPIDFAEAASAWAASKEPQNEFLSERLSMASQTEALRAGGNLDWARDLQIASMAVRAVDSRTLEDARKGVADAITTINKEHRAGASLKEPAASADQQQLARQALLVWAGEAAISATTRPAQGNDLTNVNQRNAAVTQETDTREQMLSTIRQVQEDLAELPIQLGLMEQSVRISRQSQNVTRQAQRDAQTAAPDARPAAVRAAAIAQTQSDEAFAGLSQIGQKIDPNQLRDMIQDLQSFGADVSSAAATMDRRLQPALASLHERIDARDPDGIDQAIIETRNALSLSQDELRRARQAVLDKDPLVAARWFAQQQAITAGPTSRPATDQPQDESLMATGRAWEDSLRREIEARLAAQPSTQPSLGLLEPRNSLRPWLNTDLMETMGAREDDPPQFKDALRAYFKVLLGRPDADAEP